MASSRRLASPRSASAPSRTVPAAVPSSPFHAGELALQARNGVEAQAARIGRNFADRISEPLAAFLADQRLAALTSLDAQGRVWVSAVVGERGFLQVPDERTLRIAASPIPGDPLGPNLEDGSPLGVLAIEFATRRRVRINGEGRRAPEGGIVLRPRQVYGNCPKYIQVREVLPPASDPTPAVEVRRAQALDLQQRRWIGRADTLFIGSYHPDGGADASHRGGNPGFVGVPDERTLLIPDYPGNNMFNTLGNILVNPRAGLLFVDFDRGDTLQLTGRARILADEGAPERRLGFRIEEVVQIVGGSPLRWRFLEYSPFNPS